MSKPLMIFAAGFGTRMGALTRQCPKPLLQVGGKTLLDHAFSVADHAGVDHKVVNVHYLADHVTASLADRNDVSIADETSEILDTGGGLKAAQHLLGDRTAFTLNSDAVWSDPAVLSYLENAWDPDRMDALLLTVPIERAHGRTPPGDFSLSPQGQLSRGGDQVYSGAQILSLAGLDAIKDRVFSLNQLWDQYSSAGRLFGVSYPGHWVDVGHPEGLILANHLWDSWH